MSKVNYARIKSLSDLKAEKRRVNREIREAEWRISENYFRIGQMLTPEYLLGSLSKKANGLYSTIQTVFSGYEMVSSLIRKFKRKKRRRD